MQSVAPFHGWPDRKTGHTIYKRSCNFRKRFETAALDPFHRFSGTTMDAAEWYNLRWHHNKASLAGIVLEAMVAHYIENNVACASCKYRKSLQWNGGFGVLSSWEASLERGQPQLTHPVTIGEIRNVVPRFKDKSFIPSESISLTGEATLNKGTVQPMWCFITEYKPWNVLQLQKKFTLPSMVKYGQEKWNRNGNSTTTLTDSSLVSDKTGITETEKVQRHEEEEEKKRLESLAALVLGGDGSEDDWENSRVVSKKTGIAETERVQVYKEEEENKIHKSLAALRVGGDGSEDDWEDLYFGDDCVATEPT